MEIFIKIIIIQLFLIFILLYYNNILFPNNDYVKFGCYIELLNILYL